MPEDIRSGISCGQMFVEDISKIKVMNKFVLVSPEFEDVGKFGLVLPKDTNDYLFGTIKGVGNKVKSDIKNNDRVIFERFVGHTIPTSEGDFIMVTEDNIYAVIEE